MIKRLKPGFAALVLLAASLARAHAGSQPAPATLLAQVLSAPSRVSYSGVVESVRIGAHGTEASVYRIEHHAPDLTRKTYSAPPQIFGDSEIIKGSITYAIDVSHRRIVETGSEAALEDGRSTSESEALIRQNYRMSQVGNEVFDGRPVVDVLLTNRYTNRATMFVRVDRERLIVLDKQELGANGAMLSEIRLQQVRYGDVPRSRFDLPKDFRTVQGARLQDVSRDADRVIREAGFAAKKPGSLPEGFSPLDGSLTQLRGARAVQLLYSDGIRTVSLFESAAAVAPDVTPFHPQSVSIAGRSGEYGEDGADALLTWSDGNLYYTLVGELGQAELARIAGAISP